MCEFTWQKSRYQCFISRWGIVILLEAGYKIWYNLDRDYTRTDSRPPNGRTNSLANRVHLPEGIMSERHGYNLDRDYTCADSHPTSRRTNSLANRVHLPESNMSERHGNNIENEDEHIKISENIYFTSSLLPYPNSQCLTTEELNCFCKGLKLVSNQISEALQKRPCFITLRSIQFLDCNIQNEGFTACAIQWASETFGFPMPLITVSFDYLETPCGKYVFDFSHV